MAEEKFHASAEYVAVKGRIGLRWRDEAVVFVEARPEGADRVGGPFVTLRVKMTDIQPWLEAEKGETGGRG